MMSNAVWFALIIIVVAGPVLGYFMGLHLRERHVEQESAAEEPEAAERVYSAAFERARRHGHPGECTPLDCPLYAVNPIETTPDWEHVVFHQHPLFLKSEEIVINQDVSS